jgi:hypothetical protein
MDLLSLCPSVVYRRVHLIGYVINKDAACLLLPCQQSTLSTSSTHLSFSSRLLFEPSIEAHLAMMLSRKQPQQEVASFPQLITTELCDCLLALGIQVHIEDISKPTAQTTQMIYARLIENMMGMPLDYMEQPKNTLMGMMEYKVSTPCATFVVFSTMDAIMSRLPDVVFFYSAGIRLMVRNCTAKHYILPCSSDTGKFSLSPVKSFMLRFQHDRSDSPRRESPTKDLEWYHEFRKVPVSQCVHVLFCGRVQSRGARH